MGLGHYHAIFEYLRTPEGKSVALNLDRLSPGPSPVFDVQPLLMSKRHFVYCPEVSPEIKCPSFDSFFRVMQLEGFVYNVEVSECNSRLARGSCCFPNLPISGGISWECCRSTGTSARR